VNIEYELNSNQWANDAVMSAGMVDAKTRIVFVSAVSQSNCRFGITYYWNSSSIGPTVGGFYNCGGISAPRLQIGTSSSMTLYLLRSCKNIFNGSFLSSLTPQIETTTFNGITVTTANYTSLDGGMWRKIL
jgi:hypothetical protein